MYILFIVDAFIHFAHTVFPKKFSPAAHRFTTKLLGLFFFSKNKYFSHLLMYLPA